MAANPNWKAELKAILDRHNDTHATRDKSVSHRTRQAREQGLFRIFQLLRDLGHKLAPAGLGGRHIAALMRHWIAEPGQNSGKVAPRGQPCSAAYIQQQLSFLRVFSGWIGKPGMVLPAHRYVGDPALVKRVYTAQRDKSWSGQRVDADAMIARVEGIDPHVGAQLRMLLAFGLRRKEAVMFQPHLAEVPAWAIPASHVVGARFVSFVRVSKGTKGGRLRYAAVRDEAQRIALEAACRLARAPNGHLGAPGLTLKQALDRFSNVMRSVGVTGKLLGVTPHGLRHQFAGDLFFDITGWRAPVRGGEPGGEAGALDAATMRAAYLEVARQLGHARPQIANAYLGSAAGTVPAIKVPAPTPAQEAEPDDGRPAN